MNSGDIVWLPQGSFYLPKGSWIKVGAVNAKRTHFGGYCTTTGNYSGTLSNNLGIIFLDGEAP